MRPYTPSHNVHHAQGSHQRHGVSSGMRMAVALSATLLFGGVVWACAVLFMPPDNGEIKIIKADAAPYKGKPDQPGGMDIPDQDKLIFNAVSPDGKLVAVEHIMPGPEKPMEQGTTPSSLPQAQAPAPTALGRTVEVVQGQSPPAPQPAAAATPKAGVVVDAPAAFDSAHISANKTKPQPQPQLQSQSQPQPQPQPQIESPSPQVEVNAAVEPPATPAPATDVEKPQAAVSSVAGKVHVQLASYGDRAQAEKAMTALKSKYANTLGGVPLLLAEADIKGRGHFYRIQAAVADNASAQKLCAGIKAEGGVCVLVHP